MARVPRRRLLRRAEVVVAALEEDAVVRGEEEVCPSGPLQALMLYACRAESIGEGLNLYNIHGILKHGSSVSCGCFDSLVLPEDAAPWC